MIKSQWILTSTGFFYSSKRGIPIYFILYCIFQRYDRVFDKLNLFTQGNEICLLLSCFCSDFYFLFMIAK